MARHSQRSRRCSDHSAPTCDNSTPAEPVAPHWNETVDDGGGFFTVLMEVPNTIPAGAVSFNVYWDWDLDPPTTLRATGVGLGYTFQTESHEEPANVYCRVGAVNECGTIETLGTRIGVNIPG